jgi:hypothetical protein
VLEDGVYEDTPDEYPEDDDEPPDERLEEDEDEEPPEAKACASE